MEDAFDDLVKELLTEGQLCTFRTGEFIIKKDNMPEYLFWIEEGDVLFMNEKLEEKGKFPLHQLIGLKELLTGEPYKIYGASKTPVTLYTIHKNIVLSILNRSLQTRSVLVKYFFKNKDKGNFLVYE